MKTLHYRKFFHRLALGLSSLAAWLPHAPHVQATTTTPKSSKSKKNGKAEKKEPFFKLPNIEFANSGKSAKQFPWKRNIVTTTFWIGENPTKNNPVPNHMSSWDMRWKQNYGGYDNPNPKQRSGYLPKGFTPRQNPFYIALPYNDLTRKGYKKEASSVIPWFDSKPNGKGKSTLKGRWVAIRFGDKIAYAQWEDCGPFRTDHWEYVFGDERPKGNLNKGAGLDVSPAVRDYLGMRSTDVTDWKFVEFEDIPHGPWATHGSNNTFVQNRRGSDDQPRLVKLEDLP